MRFKGWTLQGPRNVQLKEFDTEVGGGLVAVDDSEFGSMQKLPLKDDQAVIRNRVSGICRSDLWVYADGGDVRRPRGCQFGHEMVSEIVEKGKAVEDLEIGQRVYSFPLRVKESSRYAGRPGGYSELIVVDKAKLGNNLYPVPDKVSDASAAMIEPFSIGFQSALITKARAGQKAVVAGTGPIGLAAAICLREMGLEDVLIIGRSEKRLGLVRSLDTFCAFSTCNMMRPDWIEQLYEHFGTSITQLGKAVDVDIWIDAVGDKETLESMYNNAKSSSVISLVGVHQQSVNLDLRRMTIGRISMLGNGGYSPTGEEIPRVMRALESGRYATDRMVSASYPFAAFDEAIEYALDNRSALKVQIEF